MATMNSLKNILSNKEIRFDWLTEKGFFNLMPSKSFIKKKYKIKMNKKLNLKTPTTYCEKVQWLKLYDFKKEYVNLVDKYEVKKIVGEKIGYDHIIETYGIYNNFDEIDFDSLPNQFVIKCTHDSGGIAICKDKSSFDINEARAKITKCLKRNYYKFGREKPYKYIKPRIIIEKYLEDSKAKELIDYKFFAFDGVVPYMFIATGRQNKNSDVKFDFFDMDFNHLDLINGHQNAEITPSKPVSFDEMKKYASILSKGLRHVRVDFYEVDGFVYFGEMTFFHHGGWTPFVPEKWDYEFGKYIKINDDEKGE